MSDFTFNPNKRTKDDGKGTGRIRLGDDDADTPENDGEDTSPAKKKKGGLTSSWKAWAIGGAAVVTLGVGAAVVFDGDEPSAPPPVQYEEVVQPQTPPAPTVITAATVQAESIAEKNRSIYVNQRDFMYDAFVRASGQETRRGNDFAVHVSLFDRGGVSVLIADGDHAGTRVSFFPKADNGDGEMVYERIGREIIGADGQTVQYETLDRSDRESVTVDMENPSIRGQGVSVSQGDVFFEKVVRQGGQTAVAFQVLGDPVEDGVFSIVLYNGDSYNIDLNTGEYSFDSAFLVDPYYEDKLDQGIQITPIQIDGRLPQVFPPQAAPAPRP